MPIAPLRAWLQWQYPSLSNLAIAHLVGRDERMVRRWRSDPNTTLISDANVDLILTRLGHPYMLRELYPDLDEVAGAKLVSK